MRLRTSSALAAAVIAVTAGCSAQPSTTAGHPVTTPSTTTPSTTPSTSVSTSGSPSTTIPPTTAGPTSCTTSQLRLSTGAAEGAAGTTYRRMRLANVGSQPCTMFGYPGVSFLDAGGSQRGLAAARDETVTAHEVVVRPGASAHFTIAIPDAAIFDPSTCQPAQVVTVQVYPPNERSALHDGFRTSICTTRTGQARVDAVT